MLSRLIRLLGRRQIDIRSIFEIAYGRRPTQADLDRLRSFGVSETMQPVSQLRAIISAFEQYSHATPVSVRFSKDNLVPIKYDNGLTFFADRHDYAVGRHVILTGDFEPHVTNALRRFLQRGMTAIDVGANVGYQTLHMAHAVGSVGKIMAIEPSAENCRLILANAQHNSFSQIEVWPFAAFDVKGIAVLSSALGSNGYVSSATDVEDSRCTVVPTVPLDDLVGDRHIDLIKIDVEGGEYRAMLGALRTLEVSRPIVISEYCPHMLADISRVEPIQYLSLFSELGYRIHIIDRDRKGFRFIELDRLLTEWGNPAKIEDLLFLPE